jgi:methyl-accepting chemotaxis protein
MSAGNFTGPIDTSGSDIVVPLMRALKNNLITQERRATEGRRVTDTSAEQRRLIDMMTEYLERIAKGDLPPKVTDAYKGEHSALKNNMNATIDMLNEARHVSVENQRLKAALDNATTNVMIADNERNIVYMNKSVGAMLAVAESDVRKVLPDFNASRLLGSNMDQFHKNPAHQKNMLASFTNTHRVQMQIGGRTFSLIANPIITGQGERLGAVVEWADRTTEVAAEKNVSALVESAINGDLSKRISLEGMDGFTHDIATNINRLLDAITTPLGVVADYLQSIAEGSLPPKITDEYKGEYNAIKNNVNAAIGILNGFVDSIHYVSNEQTKGDIDALVDTSKFHGIYKTMAQGINEMTGTHISVIKKVMACTKKFGEGDFEAPLERFPGKKAFINETIEQVRTNLKSLIEDTGLLVAGAKEGNLSRRVDPSRHQGDFRKIIFGVNQTLDAVIIPIQETVEQVKNYSRGNIDVELKGEFNGDFAELKKRLGYLAATMKGIIDSVAYVKEEHDRGATDVAISAELFMGDFSVMADNINQLVASHIALQNRVVEVVQHYGKGDFSIDMDRLPGRKGQITAAVDGVKASLTAMQSEITSLAGAALAGNLAARADTGKFEYSFKAMAEGINATLDAVIGPLNVAASYVDRIAKGDIPDRITDPYNGDFNTIKNNLNTCIEAVNLLVADANTLSHAALDGCIQTRVDASKHQGDFRSIVEGVNATLETIVTPIVAVKSAVNSISMAAREISAGNADLSQRTEQQAASLEETVYSMEELASTVRQNTDNAKQANQMALAASEVAAKGGGVVQQVVDTMSAINESARKIVDIISVIDGIALQTNILALNAAVEAARAGEQGRGFAVVASEVRNLAQRSAAAAKEIKALIGDSVEKVEGGSRLVSEAGKTMDEIVVSVKRVSDIMAEIAVASVEQSSGIDQVNRAVTQMDEMTQQNAALVEQAAAAAESLEEQAITLMQTVAQFRLDSDERPTAPHRAHSLAATHKPAVRLAGGTARPCKNMATAAKPSQQNDEWIEF